MRDANSEESVRPLLLSENEVAARLDRRVDEVVDFVSTNCGYVCHNDACDSCSAGVLAYPLYDNPMSTSKFGTPAIPVNELRQTLRILRSAGLSVWFSIPAVLMLGLQLTDCSSGLILPGYTILLILVVVSLFSEYFLIRKLRKLAHNQTYESIELGNALNGVEKCPQGCSNIFVLFKNGYILKAFGILALSDLFTDAAQVGQVRQCELSSPTFLGRYQAAWSGVPVVGGIMTHATLSGLFSGMFLVTLVIQGSVGLVTSKMLHRLIWEYEFFPNNASLSKVSASLADLAEWVGALEASKVLIDFTVNLQVEEQRREVELRKAICAVKRELPPDTLGVDQFHWAPFLGTHVSIEVSCEHADSSDESDLPEGTAIAWLRCDDPVVLGKNALGKRMLKRKAGHEDIHMQLMRIETKAKDNSDECSAIEDQLKDWKTVNDKGEDDPKGRETKCDWKPAVKVLMDTLDSGAMEERIQKLEYKIQQRRDYQLQSDQGIDVAAPDMPPAVTEAEKEEIDHLNKLLRISGCDEQKATLIRLKEKLKEAARDAPPNSAFPFIRAPSGQVQIKRVPYLVQRRESQDSGQKTSPEPLRNEKIELKTVDIQVSYRQVDEAGLPTTGSGGEWSGLGTHEATVSDKDDLRSYWKLPNETSSSDSAEQLEKHLEKEIDKLWEAAREEAAYSILKWSILRTVICENAPSLHLSLAFLSLQIDDLSTVGSVKQFISLSLSAGAALQKVAGLLGFLWKSRPKEIALVKNHPGWAEEIKALTEARGEYSVHSEDGTEMHIDTNDTEAMRLSVDENNFPVRVKHQGLPFRELVVWGAVAVFIVLVLFAAFVKLCLVKICPSHFVNISTMSCADEYNHGKHRLL